MKSKNYQTAYQKIKRRDVRKDLITKTVTMLLVMGLGLYMAVNLERHSDALRNERATTRQLNEAVKLEQERQRAIEAEKAKVEQQKSQVETENSKLKQDIEVKDRQLQAKAQQKAQLASVKLVNASPTRAQGSTGNCGDNQYKQFIYQKESGCNTGARNAGGCFGIGQACPGSKIAHCGTDFACQDAWFSGYAQSRYGGWANAYNAWRAQGWW